MLAVQAIPEALENHLGIRVTDGIQTPIHQLIEQLPGVGHVEVAGQGEVAAGGVVSTDKWVTVGHGVTRMCAVAQMPDENLAQERAASFQLQVAQLLESGGAQPVDVAHDGVEDPLDGVVLVGTDALDVLGAGGHVELDHGDAGPVLPSIVLLFHQQVQLAQTPGGV